MHCHSRFREYLQAAFERRGNPEVHDLRVAHGLLLDRRRAATRRRPTS